MKQKVILVVLFSFGVLAACPPGAGILWGQDDSVSAKLPSHPVLTGATMCEGILGNDPLYPTVVFSVDNGNAYCWSAFDQITKKDVICHYWYRKDALVASIRLVVQPPKWASYSNIRLRDTDKGPWRVDITDSENNVLQTLRFSITD